MEAIHSVLHSTKHSVRYKTYLFKKKEKKWTWKLIWIKLINQDISLWGNFMTDQRDKTRRPLNTVAILFKRYTK